MMFTDVSDKKVGQFVGLYEDKEVSFGPGLTFRVVVYAAESMGAICPEYNGVAVLRDARKPNRKKPVLSVTASRLAQAASGYYGMTVGQKKLFDELCTASFEKFQQLLGVKLLKAA